MDSSVLESYVRRKSHVSSQASDVVTVQDFDLIVKLVRLMSGNGPPEPRSSDAGSQSKEVPNTSTLPLTFPRRGFSTAKVWKAKSAADELNPGAGARLQVDKLVLQLDGDGNVVNSDGRQRDESG